MKKSENERLLMRIADIEQLLLDSVFGDQKDNPFAFENMFCDECLDYQNKRPQGCKEVHVCPTCGYEV